MTERGIASSSVVLAGLTCIVVILAVMLCFRLSRGPLAITGVDRAFPRISTLTPPEG